MHIWLKPAPELPADLAAIGWVWVDRYPDRPQLVRGALPRDRWHNGFIYAETPDSAREIDRMAYTQA